MTLRQMAGFRPVACRSVCMPSKEPSCYAPMFRYKTFPARCDDGIDFPRAVQQIWRRERQFGGGDVKRGVWAMVDRWRA